ncbi:MAG: hypothetical protein Q9164_002039, partial [Protoblastenia rupestris]
MTAGSAHINETQGIDLQFPIIADAEREIVWRFGMVDWQDVTNRDEGGNCVYDSECFLVIDPAKKIRLTMIYLASTGRNMKEALRVVDSLQMGVTTPIDWVPGDDVIVPPSVKTEDARKKFGKVREVKP